MTKSKIEWTDEIWDPIPPRIKRSDGCPNYHLGFDLADVLARMGVPRRWRKPRRVWVDSPKDLFHRSVPDAYLRDVFLMMVLAERHQFHVVTRKPGDIRLIWPPVSIRPNIWIGARVENEEALDRIDDLRETPACVRFLALEPLLGPLPRLDLRKIDWVRVGGAPGPKAKPVDESWVIDIRDQCRGAGVPFFFKQWGGPGPEGLERRLQGRTWNQYPRESPEARAWRERDPARSKCRVIYADSPKHQEVR